MRGDVPGTQQGILRDSDRLHHGSDHRGHQDSGHQEQRQVCIWPVPVGSDIHMSAMGAGDVRLVHGTDGIIKMKSSSNNDVEIETL